MDPTITSVPLPSLPQFSEFLMPLVSTSTPTPAFQVTDLTNPIGQHFDHSNQPMFRCLDFGAVGSPSRFPFVHLDGVDSPTLPGQSIPSRSIAEEDIRSLPSSRDEFLKVYWNWGYYHEGEERFAERLADTMRVCIKFGIPYTAVNTIYRSYSADYHIITCASRELMDLSETLPLSNKCESHSVGKVDPFYDGGKISRGGWYDNEVVALYDWCDLHDRGSTSYSEEYARPGSCPRPLVEDPLNQLSDQKEPYPMPDKADGADKILESLNAFLNDPSSLWGA